MSNRTQATKMRSRL